MIGMVGCGLIAGGMAPDRRMSRILMPLAALLGTTALVALPGMALADCVNTGGANFECSGVLTTGQTITTTNANVTGLPGFSIAASESYGMVITAKGNLSYISGESDLTARLDALIVIVQSDDAISGSAVIETGGALSGGRAGIVVTNFETGGTSVITSGHVEGRTEEGIRVNGVEGGAGSIVLSTASVTGGTTGIFVDQFGTGQTQIIAGGHVEGGSASGILARNNTVGGGRLDIHATSVTGGFEGISVSHDSGADLWVTASGHVEGRTGGGIVVNGSGAERVTIEVASVSGETTGIFVTELGAQRAITATGHVEGRLGDGIFVNHGGGLLSANLASVSGGNRGIHVQRFLGTTEITATGHVEGAAGEGVLVNHFNAGEDMAIAVASVTGATHGIVGTIFSIGDIRITATGEVIGRNGDGIFALHDSGNHSGNTDITATDVTGGAGAGIRVGAGNDLEIGTTVTIEAANVTGATQGILVEGTGLGETRVTTSGHVEGQGEAGIDITANGAVVVDVAGVTGANYGISVNKTGTGDVSLTATGPVTGGTGSGIYAETDIGSLRIEAGDVSGDDYGIWVRKTGAGPTTIATDGLVQGRHAAIFANGSAAFELKNLEGGTWQDVSGRASDLAIMILGGVNTEATIINDGTIIGGLTMSGSSLGASLRFENKGLWTFTGSSSMFGATAGNEVINAAGATVIGAVNAAQREDTVLNHLPLFTNQGRVSLVDGAAGDRFTILHGGAVFGPGSILAVDIGGNDLSDLVQAIGTVQLTGAALEVNLAGPLLLNTPYTVLRATGGLSGTFASITGAPTGAFLQIEDHYDAGYAWLELVRSRDFADAGRSPNQIATAGALDSLSPGTPLADAMLTLTDDAAALRALDQFSGEIHLSSQTALIEDSGFLRAAVNDRLRSAFAGGAPAAPALSFVAGGTDYRLPADQRPAFWGTAYGSTGSTDGNGNAADLDRDSSGLLIGADQQVGEWRLGLVTGYSDSDFEAADRSSSGKAKSYHLGVYGGTDTGRIAIRTALAYSWHDLGSSRSVMVGGLADNLSADFSASTIQAYGELAWRMGQPASGLESFVNLAHVSLRSDGFTETGGPAALTVAAKRNDVTFTTLGLRVERDFILGGNAASFKGTAGWRHAFGDTVPAGIHAFAGSGAFAIAGAPIARDSAVIEAGLEVEFAPQASFGITYSGQLAGSAEDHGLKASLLVKF